MSLANDPRPSGLSADYIGGPLFTGIDMLAGILVIVMILGPLTAGALHANPQGWDTSRHQQGER